MTIETSQPERPQGTIEMDRPSDEAVRTNDAPSVAETDRYGLGDNAKWLLRQYVIELDADGLPQFAPIPSVLKELETEAPDVLAEARGQMEREGSESVLNRVEELRSTAVAFHDAVDSHYSDISEWIARTTVVWPIDNQVARNLFQATFGEYKLAGSVSYAIQYGRIKNASNREIMSDEKLATQDGWVQTYYTELAIWDAVSQAVEDHEYNLPAMLAQGYRQQCAIDTKKWLRGGNQHFGPSPSNDSAIDPSEIRAALRRGRTAS